MIAAGRRIITRSLRTNKPGSRRKQLSREEVEAIAERARNEQKIWDAERRIFGGHIGWGHPLLWVLAMGAVLLHFANGRREERQEKNAEYLDMLRHETGRPHQDTSTLISHKKRQLDFWQTTAIQGGEAAAEARERVATLKAELADLQQRP